MKKVILAVIVTVMVSTAPQAQVHQSLKAMKELPPTEFKKQQDENKSRDPIVQFAGWILTKFTELFS